LSPSEQLKFFDGIVLRNNTLHRYIEIDGDELTLKISNAVVDTIIGELLFRPEDEMAALEHDDGEAFDPNIVERVARLIKLKRNALLLFKPDGGANDGSYDVVIKNVKWFQLIIKHASCGMSFRQIAAAIGHTRDVMSMEQFEQCEWPSGRPICPRAYRRRSDEDRRPALERRRVGVFYRV
jgi:hypothetical protein